MSLSTLAHRFASTFPHATAPLLRSALRLGIVPDRADWLVNSLKKSTDLRWQRRVVTLNDGSRIQIDSRSAIGREIYYEGSYEPALCRILEEWLKPGMTCFDAGANIGEFTVRAAKLVGPSGSVHAFEASPATFADLQANVALNHLRNVTANHVALSGQSGELEFYLSRGPASGSSSLRAAHDFSGQVVKVRAVTIDDYVRSSGISQVDFIKIDVEGAEMEAFRGAMGVLSTRPRPVVIFEYHPVVSARFGVTRQDMVGLFSGLEYQLTDLGLSASGLPRANEDLPVNYLAVPAERRQASALA